MDMAGSGDVKVAEAKAKSSGGGLADVKMAEKHHVSVSTVRLQGGVGLKQQNNHDDVQIVQKILNKVSHVKLKEDGRCGPRTIEAIKAYQLKHSKSLKADSVLHPNGPTIKSLLGSGAKPAAAPKPQFPEVEYLARTIYGEARGESYESKVAVGWVIRNRVARGSKKWGKTYASVVTSRLQFTCWSEKLDPGNYEAVMNPSGPAWDEAQKAATEVSTALEAKNPLVGVTHYYSPAAQAALHKKAPNLYKEKPLFVTPTAKPVPNPEGVSEKSFAFFKNVK